MKKEIPVPIVATIVVVLCVIAGTLIWHYTVPATVIVPKGKMPPPPDYRMGAGRTRIAPPDYRQGASP